MQSNIFCLAKKKCNTYHENVQRPDMIISVYTKQIIYLAYQVINQADALSRVKQARLCNSKATVSCVGREKRKDLALIVH